MLITQNSFIAKCIAICEHNVLSDIITINTKLRYLQVYTYIYVHTYVYIIVNQCDYRTYQKKEQASQAKGFFLNNDVMYV